jgi:predicted hotdog family 3-hydroxylacyl-ACP dehydratase
VAEDIEIRELIPHAGSMCLLERVVYWDDARIECLTDSHRAAGNPLRHQDRLPVAMGVEYAAQAAAVHGGLLARSAAGAALKPRRGYLAVLSQVRWLVDRLDDRAAPLRVAAQRQGAGAGGAVYEFTIHAAGQLLLDGSLMVALVPADPREGRGESAEM